MVLPVQNPTKSYWIEAAQSPLRDFQSTPDLPTEADVVIVGSGYTGATAAYWIHKYTQNAATKPRVVMLEAGEICGRATGRNGGQLRPHAYSRYPAWKERFGSDGAMELIRHEMAHLDAFKELADEEDIAKETCLAFGETFDAAMTEEALARLFAAYKQMKLDRGIDDPVVRVCRKIDDPKEAEDFSQMKGALGAIVHPTGQIWPYKFVHALLRIILDTGILNLQAHTPVQTISEQDVDGFVTVQTDRGSVKTRAVVHATNRWASHLLPEFQRCIVPSRASLAAIKAPEYFLKHTGSQHFDAAINNYHLQIPPPFNTIILGGVRKVLCQHPEECYNNDKDDKYFPGVVEYCETWARRDILDWPQNESGELALPATEGGCWTGTYGTSTDSFPFVGPVPNRAGHFVAAGFNGHGMPRILLSTAHIIPLVLESIGQEHTAPKLVENYPPLPGPFHATAERIEKLGRTVDLEAKAHAYCKQCEESAQKEFCQKW
ncbi:fad dependent oxidoreductase superfamily like protein [Zymoseptoria brevis]|uniref:Fad dependent oxidoreductase superfamily like protein n=1 Tax=Zymoseptoria brevis TaxID=1047168 RepID=A0A0F4GAE7_9PEZI|nr:fad dependent oxidoreductase superfamily like protein [Zymoseptoria brevis]